MINYEGLSGAGSHRGAEARRGAIRKATEFWGEAAMRGESGVDPLPDDDNLVPCGWTALAVLGVVLGPPCRNKGREWMIGHDVHGHESLQQSSRWSTSRAYL